MTESSSRICTNIENRGEAGTVERLVGLLGDPVAHTLSPAMHNAAFAALGIRFRYIAFRVEGAGFERAMEGLEALGSAGTNITIPHKERAFRWVRNLDPSAARTGAVNTVVFDENGSTGYNTDLAGARAAIGKLAPRTGTALVLGAGGAARAVICALLDEGFERVMLSNRSSERAGRLLEDVAAADPDFGSASVEVIPWGEEPPVPLDLLVNATSLGLGGSPWPDGTLDRVLPLAREGAILDLVYSGDGDTPLCAAAKSLGIPSASGLEMLLQQGAAALTLFTGMPAPVGAMRAALDTTPGPGRTVAGPAAW